MQFLIKKDGLVKDYPAFKEPTLQKSLDQVAFFNDSHKLRMEAKRANPGPDDIIPRSISKRNPKGLSLKLVRQENYQFFFNSSSSFRNNYIQTRFSKEGKKTVAVPQFDMRLTIKAVIKSMKRDSGKRTEDKAKGKSHWVGDGTKNRVY